MSTPPRWLLALLATLVVGSVGCEKKTAASGKSSASATSAKAKGEPPKTTAKDERSGASAEPARLEGEGQSCVGDYTCPGFLRCIQRACTVPPAISGVHDAQTPVAIFRKSQDVKSAEIARFYMELAISPQEQQRGLMFRRSMKPDWGMIFIYDQDGPRSFWMQNTYIPLDMVFIDSRGFVVGVVEEAEPLTTSSRAVNGNSRYVLELRAGTASKVGIKRGVWMSTKNLRDDRAPRP